MNSIGSGAYFRTGSFIPFMLNPDRKVIGTFIEIPCLTAFNATPAPLLAWPAHGALINAMPVRMDLKTKGILEQTLSAMLVSRHWRYEKFGCTAGT